MRVLNIAVIFAGGTGVRMNSKDDKPKQFLEVRGKPIIEIGRASCRERV